MFVIVNAMVALLRGINVGGRNRVPMADLRDLFTSLGFEQVGSVIQSGNVCFTLGPGRHNLAAESLDTESDLCAEIGAAVTARFGVHTPVLIRTANQLVSAVGAHPFAVGDLEPKCHHVMFLASAPAETSDDLADLSPHDHHMVIGREIHVLYTAGSARSKFTVSNVEQRLGIVATARNISTCSRILDLLRA